MSNPIPKIILHSDQSLALTGQRDTEIIRSLSGKRNPRILYLPSASNSRQKVFDEKKAYYERIGFSNVELFEPENMSLEKRQLILETADVVHLSGGEIIPFAQRIRETSCDQLLKTFLQRGGVVVGVSAGAMVLGSTFKSASLFKERGQFHGVGLYDFEIIPHANEIFQRNDLLKAFSNQHKINVYAMNDGGIIVIHGKKIKINGAVQYFEGNAHGN